MTRHATVQDAYAQQASGAVYLDVRSVPEFERAHPANAVNIPLLDIDPRTRQMLPNPGFVAQVQAQFSPDTPLLVGCHAGVRSVQACQVLERNGFTNLTNVLGGFGGSSQGDTGWLQAGLPIEP